MTATETRRSHLWSTMVVGALIVVGAGYWGLHRWRDSTTAVDVDAAAAQFADLFGEGFDGIAGLPSPGVYRYATRGGEGIDILTKPRHWYPAESAIVVTPAGCGVRVEWMPLRERSEWWQMCLVGGGIEVVSYGGVHEFFNNRDDRTMGCAVTQWLVPPPEASLTSEFACTGSGLVHEWSTRVIGRATVRVDGEPVDGMRIRSTIVTKGDATGTTTRELVLSTTGLPLWWSETTEGGSDSPLGKVHHDEDFVLTLMSLEPER